MVYRDGNDHYDWHADDTQGEVLILGIVTESSPSGRPILIRPKKELGGEFQDGDEEIVVFVR